MSADLDTITFKKLMTDVDGDFSKAEYKALATRMIKQGRRPERVIHAMVRAALELAHDGGIADYGDFLRWMIKNTEDTYERFCKFVDEVNARADEQEA